MSEKDTYYIFNHVDLTIEYHKSEPSAYTLDLGNGAHIVKVTVCC